MTEYILESNLAKSRSANKWKRIQIKEKSIIEVRKKCIKSISLIKNKSENRFINIYSANENIIGSVVCYPHKNKVDEWQWLTAGEEHAYALNKDGSLGKKEW